MSEPVLPPSRAPEPRPVSQLPPTVEVICTDNDRHRRVSIGGYMKVGDEWVRYSSEGHRHKGIAIANSGGSCRLQCSRCPRDTLRNADKFKKMLDAWAASGLDCLDLSHLPF